MTGVKAYAFQPRRAQHVLALTVGLVAGARAGYVSNVSSTVLLIAGAFIMSFTVGALAWLIIAEVYANADRNKVEAQLKNALIDQYGYTIDKNTLYRVVKRTTLGTPQAVTVTDGNQQTVPVTVYLSDGEYNVLAAA